MYKLNDIVNKYKIKGTDIEVEVIIDVQYSNPKYMRMIFNDFQEMTHLGGLSYYKWKYIDSRNGITDLDNSLIINASEKALWYQKAGVFHSAVVFLVTPREEDGFYEINLNTDVKPVLINYDDVIIKQEGELFIYSRDIFNKLFKEAI